MDNKLWKKRFTQKDIESLSESDAQDVGNKLATLISEADKDYHMNDDPKFTDAEYDTLKLNLYAFEKFIPNFFKIIGYSRNVGSSPSSLFEKVEHSIPMLSLNNGLDNEEIQTFVSGIKKFLGVSPNYEIWFTSEPKIDGLSLAITYENGFLTKALTRGDGSFGENVTLNAKRISDIPVKIETNMQVLEVRGEVYMSKDDFMELNKTQSRIGAKLFANPRNAAAGSLRQLNSQKTQDRKLRFFAYAWGTLSEPLAKDQFDAIKKLGQLGFKTNRSTRLCKTVKDLLEHYDEIALTRPNLDYDIDGVVYKVNDLGFQNRLGHRSTTPRWAIAHKFPAEIAITEILDIEIQVGRTGSLSPVARLKPVNIGGVIVSNATLHNKDYILGRDSKGFQIRGGVDIRIRDWVEVYRAGDVIPKVKNVLLHKRDKNSQAYVFPILCPICGSEVSQESNDSTVRCTGGIKCSAQAVEKIRHFVSRKAFNIEGFGKRLVEQFFLNGWIKKPSDIFFLEKNFGSSSKVKIKDFDGWGDQSAKKLFQSINNRRVVSLSRMIYSLGIRHVGEQASILLAKHHGSWSNFYKNIIAAKDKKSQEWHELALIDGIGNMTASSLVDYFSSDEGVWIISNLTREIKINDFSSNVVVDSPFQNYVIVFSGLFKRMSRAEAKSRAEEIGAKVSSSVSKRTDLLVIGDNPGAKVKTANKLGIKIVSEQEWFDVVDGQS